MTQNEYIASNVTKSGKSRNNKIKSACALDFYSNHPKFSRIWCSFHVSSSASTNVIKVFNKYMTRLSEIS